MSYKLSKSILFYSIQLLPMRKIVSIKVAVAEILWFEGKNLRKVEF